MENNQHNINDVVWIKPFDGFGVIIGVTPQLDLVVRWYNDDGEQFTAVVNQDDCVQPTNQN
jgi:hypothetical protein